MATHLQTFLKRPLFIATFLVLIAFSIQQILRYNSEQHIILEAVLVDDITSLRLTLKDDQIFMMKASTMFGDQTFSGIYALHENKIIFIDRPYVSDFIPDTLTIINDKIIINFDSLGKPVTEFATYFRIDKNEIKNAP